MHTQIKSRAAVSGFLLALLVTFSGGALAAGILGTKHDLSVTGGGTIKSTTQTEICIFCHTPHDAFKTDNIPLWNHEMSQITTYGMYTSPTLDATDLADVGVDDPAHSAVSNLCLSCHDGTVAVNSFNNPSNTSPNTPMVGGVDKITGSANLGAAADALKNDHPVNFTYNPGTGAGLDSTLVPTASLTGVKLYNNKVQCASCHDPHTSVDPTGKAFLRVSMSGSTLCFACHNK
ncbi:MAG: cytochrome c3 family protein [Thiobacillus sp.]|nr:cytochrome c3 family protein [Thiobacillus sp.]MDP2978419.1 cytochrome c3 family protein [Thiobacillus sp.]